MIVVEVFLSSPPKRTAIIVAVIPPMIKIAVNVLDVFPGVDDFELLDDPLPAGGNSNRTAVPATESLFRVPRFVAMVGSVTALDNLGNFGGF